MLSQSLGGAELAVENSVWKAGKHCPYKVEIDNQLKTRSPNTEKIEALENGNLSWTVSSSRSTSERSFRRSPCSPGLGVARKRGENARRRTSSVVSPNIFTNRQHDNCAVITVKALGLARDSGDIMSLNLFSRWLPRSLTGTTGALSTCRWNSTSSTASPLSAFTSQTQSTGTAQSM